MIKIEFEAATGADLRKEMLDLLGITGVPNFEARINSDNLKSALERTAVDLENTTKVLLNETAEPDTNTLVEAPKPEKTTRTRRSKAEIEAEAALAANTGSEEPPASTKSAAEDFNSLMDKIKTEKTETTITADDLTKKCVELGRNGKRDAVLAVFESQFGGATISKKDGKPQLTAEQYPAVMEALNTLA